MEGKEAKMIGSQVIRSHTGEHTVLTASPTVPVSSSAEVAVEAFRVFQHGETVDRDISSVPKEYQGP